MSNLALRPVYCASVSGGKDSLYMLNLILNNLDKYPLDMVIHYDLEIDWGWVKRVVDFMEFRCKSYNIPFYRIKPKKTWLEYYNKKYFPTNNVRWCSNEYKKSCTDQIVSWLKDQNCKPVFYIGFCADETKRFKYTIGENWKLMNQCYPLAEEGINEDTILEWAKEQPIFEDWYKLFRRQGCMLCPLITRKELAYMSIKEPAVFNFYIDCIRKNEQRFNHNFYGKQTLDSMLEHLNKKWIPLVEEEIERIDK